MIGFIALVINIYVLQLKNPRHIILYEAPAAFLWTVQYFMLGAISGGLIHILITIRAIAAAYLPQKQLSYMIFGYIAIAWGVGLFGFQSWYDILPMLATTNGSLMMLFFRDNRPMIARGFIVGLTLWTIYDCLVGSWMGALCSSLMIASVIIGMARHEKWALGTCYKMYTVNLVRSLFMFPRTYP